MALEGVLPRGARPDLSVEGVIELERLVDVLYVGRPIGARPESQITLFKLDPQSDVASRCPVRLGRSSVNTVEILSGLQEGDAIIVSDMTKWEAIDHIRLR